MGTAAGWSTTPSEDPLYHLSAAIERGDKEEARYWLYKSFENRWSRLVAIDLGRFSPEARRK